ncbi:MAG: 23S rRNA (uracil(1939)-C(5))-methyltransferase RlmD [Xanthomonadales bacterium]|nr:23S rRNA (uracil(1939)-C(5))-methyltransferase RlmD [Xanthomonadales bacterium]MCC6594393.1 23S rRNA (uracil(1939)-C(5))-methyltransferase RlmD [Xanthomonadales bacterium]MCE7932121.1 23S rRNA (uracil(1939)-C(5))-methyltransferase RlmD [Xanthomonadales bacterium PRO6]
MRDASFETEIEDLAHDGRGIARAGTKTVFVDGALPGERVRARRIKPHRQYDDALAEEVLRASPDRVVPRCAHTTTCSGCSLQHLAPERQIEFKQKQLLDGLERIGRVRPQRLLPALQREIWGYRRKARLSVRHVDRKGRALVGFREANGRYVAEIEHCPVLDARVGARIGALSALVTGMDARASIPQIEVAVAARAVLVVRHLHPLSPADHARLVEFAGSNDVDIVLQPAGLDSLVGLHGEPPPELEYLIDGDLRLRYRPLDFVQVNDSINQAMVAQALDLLQVGAQDRVLDLYCGLGNFTLPIARRAAFAFGVEGDAGLIERARGNAVRNQLLHIDYAVADLSQDQREAPWARAAYTRMLLDPPRAGAERVFDYLPGASVERVVYVSCHPGTLARDAALLTARGYTLEAAGVMDMFPHTAHVESMALFVRR